MKERYKGKYLCEDIDRILAQAEKTVADVDYIAMMADINIDMEVNDEQEIYESKDVLSEGLLDRKAST